MDTHSPSQPNEKHEIDSKHDTAALKQRLNEIESTLIARSADLERERYDRNETMIDLSWERLQRQQLEAWKTRICHSLKLLNVNMIEDVLNSRRCACLLYDRPGHLSHRRKKRFFILKGRYLLIYKSAQEMDSLVKQLDLEGCQVKPVQSKDQSSHIIELKLSSGDVHHMICDSLKEREEWLRSLSESINLGGTDTLADMGLGTTEAILELLFEEDLELATQMIDASVSSSAAGEDNKLCKLLVEVFNTRDQTVRLIKSELFREMQPQEGSQQLGKHFLLFPPNSFAAKLWAEHAKTTGSSYVSDLFIPLITALQRNPNHSTETDEHKAPDEAVRAENIARLKHYATSLIDMLIVSEDACPGAFRELCRFVVVQLLETHPSEATSALATLFVQRYLCPAMVSPTDYGVECGELSTNTRRTLLLLAQVYQGLSAGQKFDHKKHLICMNDWIQQNSEKLRGFLLRVAQVSTTSSKSLGNVVRRRSRSFSVSLGRGYARARSTTVTLDAPSKPLNENTMASLRLFLVQNAERIDPPKKARVNRLVSSLTDLLRDDLCVQYFSEFCVQEHNKESLDFYLSVTAFQYLTEPNEIALEAKRIYELFIEPGAEKEINISETCRKKIISEMANPTLFIFRTACESVRELMEADAFPRFQKHDLFADLKQALNSR